MKNSQKQLQRLKVIRGKRGRGVPVLFSKDMQQHIKLLLETRSNFLDDSNLFLFGNVNTNNSITGYKIIQKHAKLCGAKNSEALTSTKLRKHLATLTQVFNMTNNDIEQLATFMGPIRLTFTAKFTDFLTMSIRRLKLPNCYY